MFKSVILLAVLGVCLAQRFSSFRKPTFPRPQQFVSPARSVGPVVRLLRSESEGPRADGSYFFDFASEDGISRNEQGRLKAPDTYEITGAYSFTAPDGTPVRVSYIADELGFRADSPNLPVAPPAPPHSLAQIRAAEQEFARRGQTFRG